MSKIVNGTTYHDNTPDEVIQVLEEFRQQQRKQRIRIFFGDSETGKCWMQEHDVAGYIGRTTGPNKIPLLIHNSRSLGGSAISDDCIVRIMVGGRDVYRHPNYHVPELSINPYGEHPDDEYPFSVFAGSVLHANFKKKEQAERWVAFMKGERMSK